MYDKVAVLKNSDSPIVRVRWDCCSHSKRAMLLGLELGLELECHCLDPKATLGSLTRESRCF